LNKKIKISIIDTGLSYPHPGIKGEKPDGVSVLNKVISSDYEDNLGHGTAIYGIIHRLLPDAEFFIVKVFDKSIESNIDDLLIALDFLKKKNVDIIHLSNGIPKLNEYQIFEDKIKWFIDNGSVIVSSCDNLGCNSYPASFNHVISVDISNLYKSESEYEYLENSLTNIRIKGGFQRVCWVNEQYLLVDGASYSSPYVTAMLGKWFSRGEKVSYKNAIKLLKCNATKIQKFPLSMHMKTNFKLNKAIVFPLNKETHSLFSHYDLCPFSIVGVYSHRTLGICGRKVSECLTQKIQLDLTVKNITEIEWNSDNFDSVILGHLIELSSIIKEDLLKYFIDKCIKYRKKIYSFDSLAEYENSLRKNNLSFYYPVLLKRMVPKGRLGKLFLSSTPIIGIFGTSSKQGKFNLQLDLREHFIASGYKVGQLGTEPSSFLFGFDSNFSYGYNSYIELSESETILLLNTEIQKIEQKQVDVIIVGTQGGVIPYAKYNINTIPMHQENFLSAIDFDCLIMCINSFDSIEYIARSIMYIESYTGKRVSSLVLFPRRRMISKFGLTDKFTNLSDEELCNLKNILGREFHREIFINGHKNDMNTLYNNIVSYFSDK